MSGVNPYIQQPDFVLPQKPYKVTFLPADVTVEVTDTTPWAMWTCPSRVSRGHHTLPYIHVRKVSTQTRAHSRSPGPSTHWAAAMGNPGSRVFMWHEATVNH